MLTDKQQEIFDKLAASLLDAQLPLDSAETYDDTKLPILSSEKKIDRKSLIAFIQRSFPEG
jgi:hypothetical protein